MDRRLFAVSGALKAFTITNARLSTSPSSQSGTAFGYPGTSPAISANGGSNGIVWAAENSSPAVLHAYNALNLAELYNSNQAGSRDHCGNGNKFITPTMPTARSFSVHKTASACSACSEFAGPEEYASAVPT